MPKISIIIPVYGVENYIERCVKSLFEQTLDDIEYLFIDDCTKDKSISILENILNEYPERKQQVIITKHQQNKGLPQARKTGIALARGEYIIHCDSDDWIEHDMCQLMYEKAIQENADVVMCDISKTNGIHVYSIEKGCGDVDKANFIYNMLIQKNPWSMVNKLFKRTTYFDDKIVYPKGAMGEDMVLSFQLLFRCKKIAYVSKSLYNYFYNEESISHASTVDNQIRNFKQMKDNVDVVLTFFNKNGVSDKYSDGIIKLKYMAKSFIMGLTKDKEYRKIWIDTYCEINKHILFCPRISFKEKIKFVLTYFRLYPLK